MDLPAELQKQARHRELFATFAFYAALLAVGLASVGLLAVGANPLAALVPVGGIAVAALVIKLPIRWSVNAMLFAMLVFDDVHESNGQWRTPLAAIGDLFRYRIDATLPIPGAAVTGMEVAFVTLLALRAWRRATGSRLDEGGRVETPRIVLDLVLIGLAGVVYAEAIGLAHGWGAVPYKVRNLVHPLMMTVLFLAAYRGPQDAPAIGRIFVVAACFKGILAHIVQSMARAQTGGMWNSALSHGDSIVFAIGFFLIVLRYLERPDRRLILPAIPMLGLILLGCVENDRRLVWVMIAMSCLVAYLIRPLSGWQRVVTRVLLVLVPLLLVYVAIGWNTSNKLFAPVQTLRSVSDTSHDTSALWREIETWNIAVTMREHAFLGMGLGGEYTEVMYNDDISSIYPEYREWPHNTVLALFMMMGLFGFTAHWVMLPAALFLAIRSYRMATGLNERMVAQGCVAGVVCCLVMAWGDTGAHYSQHRIVAGLVPALAAHLAVATGAWPAARRKLERLDTDVAARG